MTKRIYNKCNYRSIRFIGNALCNELKVEIDMYAHFLVMRFLHVGKR